MIQIPLYHLPNLPGFMWLGNLEKFEHENRKLIRSN